jgi:hypothetical protein
VYDTEVSGLTLPFARKQGFGRSLEDKVYAAALSSGYFVVQTAQNRLALNCHRGKPLVRPVRLEEV